jgi:UDP-3-O-[3-hydroxymyristoyl] N-acetylglucosamine deacetylase
MACLAGLSIDNMIVELDAYEVPVMDGSAGPFTRMIMEAGIQQQEAPRHFFVLKEPIELEQDGKFVGAYPDTTFKITCNIDFEHPLIRKQSCSIEVEDHVFEREISSARTFGFLHEVEYMKRYGLARGGSLDNAVVIDESGILNEGGLRYPDEFVRHKLLDCIGDFSLLGMPILAHIVTHKSGHAFNHAFLENFFSNKTSWQTLTLNKPADPACGTAKSLAI